MFLKLDDECCTPFLSVTTWQNDTFSARIIILGSIRDVESLYERKYIDKWYNILAALDMVQNCCLPTRIQRYPLILYDRTNETRRLAVVLVGDLFEVAMPVCKYLQASCTSASKVDITTFESLYIDRPHASCLPSTYSMIAFFRLVQQFSTRRIFDERSVEEVCNC